MSDDLNVPEYGRRSSDLIIGQLQGTVSGMEREMSDVKEDIRGLKDTSEQNNKLLIEISTSMKGVHEAINENKSETKRLEDKSDHLSKRINAIDKTLIMRLENVCKCNEDHGKKKPEDNPLNPRLGTLLAGAGITAFRYIVIAAIAALVLMGVSAVFFGGATPKMNPPAATP